MHVRGFGSGLFSVRRKDSEKPYKVDSAESLTAAYRMNTMAEVRIPLLKQNPNL